MALKDSYLAKGKAYRESERGRSVAKAAHAREKRRHAEKIRARYMVSNAIRDGRMAKGSKCEHCGCADKIEAHHHKGYAPPYQLDVIWLCPPCHKRADGRAAA